MNYLVFAMVALLSYLSVVVQCEDDRATGGKLDYRYIMLQSINCKNKPDETFLACTKNASGKFPYKTKEVLAACKGVATGISKDASPAKLCIVLKSLMKGDFNITRASLTLKDMEKNTEAADYFKCLQKTINAKKTKGTYDEAILNSDEQIRVQ